MYDHCVQVSAPLVAFRESVLCPDEAPEGVVVKAARVIEATTPNGCCTVRVKAHAMPSAMAAVLDDNADLIKSALETHNRHQEQRKQRPVVHNPAAAEAANGAVHGDEVAAAHTQPDAVSHRPVASDSEQHSSDELAAVHSKLTTCCREASNKHLIRLLLRAWLLGPKWVGPNLLLASEPDLKEHNGFGGSTSSSLFDIPTSQVVKAGKLVGGHSVDRGGYHPPESTGSTQNGHAAPAGEAGVNASDDAAHQHQGDVGLSGRFVDVPLGNHAAAGLLRLDACAQDACMHAQPGDHNLGVGTATEGRLGSSGQLSGLTDSSLATTDAAVRIRSAPKAGSKAGSVYAGSDASLGRKMWSTGPWQHIRGSIESGTVAGFQRAAAAGPMCDEPLWGVVFELEVRLNLPAQESTAHQGGLVDDFGLSAIDLQEDVYGPFSGQVGACLAIPISRHCYGKAACLFLLVLPLRGHGLLQWRAQCLTGAASYLLLHFASQHISSTCMFLSAHLCKV